MAAFGYKQLVQPSKYIPWFLYVCPAIWLGACGAAVEQAPRSPQAAEPVEPTLPALPPGHVWRVQVMELMSPGMPVFLQRIVVSDVQERGKFRGFRIDKLQGDPVFWQGVDLKPGDIVTRANGESIGHYDQAFAVWQSLATVPELVISYERAGVPLQLKFVIHDEDPNGKTVAPVIAPARAAGVGSAVVPASVVPAAVVPASVVPAAVVPAAAVSAGVSPSNPASSAAKPKPAK